MRYQIYQFVDKNKYFLMEGDHAIYADLWAHFESLEVLSLKFFQANLTGNIHKSASSVKNIYIENNELEPIFEFDKLEDLQYLKKLHPELFI